MKKLILSIGMCVATSIGFGQQLFQQTQFMVNPYTMNPALAGSEDFVDIKAGYRNQWLGFEDSFNDIGTIAPRTMYLSAHTSLGHDHGYYRDPRSEHKAFHGIGGFIASDKLGAFSSNSFYLSYSYNMLLLKSQKGQGHGQMYGFNGQDRHIGVRMIVGAHLGVIQQGLDASKLFSFSEITQGKYDPTIDKSIGQTNTMNPDGSLGIWIYSNNYYIGAAIRRIGANDVDFGEDFAQYNLSRHYNAMAGYKLMMSDFLLFEPSIVMKLEAGARPSVDLNALLVYDNTYTNSRGAASHKNTDLHVYTGMTYRQGAALAFLIGGVIERTYEVTYSFDLTTNQINPYEKGTHEVTVGYRLQPSKTFQTAEQRHHR